MADFSFLKNETSKKWIISAPRRAQRTNAEDASSICPFCPGSEKENEEVYRVGGKIGDSDWQIRVITNKFPFTQHHELIIHSPDHHKNFDELPFSQVELILQTYRERFLANQKNGQVYLFHNRGRLAGESLGHPHTQLPVIPPTMAHDIPPLDTSFATNVLTTAHFSLICPTVSQWPDEVWVAPNRPGKTFGDIDDEQITDLSFVLSRLIQIFDLRHGHEFPFNYYIYPGKNWYLRLIPRIKILGGFELGTGIMVNTQKPGETMAFLKAHFWEPDHEGITQDHKADYLKSV